MQWTMEQLARAMGVATPAGLRPLARVAGVSIDSRTVRPGDLFFAVHGPRHDGHNFVAQALQSGSPAAVVARSRASAYSAEIQARLFVVDDTLAALQQLAHAVLHTWRKARPGRRVGAVAGSVGKTTTKEILAELLAARFRVLRSQGNLNNDYGLPLTLLQLEDEHEALVVELGMSRTGELARLTKICEPDVGLITRIAIEHLEFFASLEEIALAERELIANLPGAASTAVLNAGDEYASRFVHVAPGKVIWFGDGPSSSFRAANIQDRGIEGTRFEFVGPHGREQLELALIGRHNVANAIAALAAASVWGVGAAEAKSVFPAMQPPDKRGEVVRFEEGFTIINDSYNSSPAALAALSEMLASTHGYKRRILAAGEMLELGATSPNLHRDAGRHAASIGGIDLILGVRGDAAEIVRGALDAGYPESRTRFFAGSEEAGNFLAATLMAGDLLLLKGSRGVRMEKILDAVRLQHAEAKAKSPESAGACRPGRN